MTRPRHTSPDDNQNAENAKLRESGCVCIVVSDLPGRRHNGPASENPLDTFVLGPDHLAWLQVEWKAGPGESFTPNEREYFQRLWIWDYIESGLLKPLAQWQQTGVPVVVAWRAEQVLEVFREMGQIANLNRQRLNSAADSRRAKTGGKDKTG